MTTYKLIVEGKTSDGQAVIASEDIKATEDLNAMELGSNRANVLAHSRNMASGTYRVVLPKKGIFGKERTIVSNQVTIFQARR